MLCIITGLFQFTIVGLYYYWICGVVIGSIKYQFSWASVSYRTPSSLIHVRRAYFFIMNGIALTTFSYEEESDVSEDYEGKNV